MLFLSKPPANRRGPQFEKHCISVFTRAYADGIYTPCAVCLEQIYAESEMWTKTPD
jgi:hypothetical protein